MGAITQNPRYIIVMDTRSRGSRGQDGRICRVLQLGVGNEHGSMPIYHAPRRDRAMGPYTTEEARQVIASLYARDEESQKILMGQAKHKENIAESQ